MVKVGLFLFAVCCALGAWMVVQGFTHDLSAIGREARAGIESGMTWREVLHVAEPSFWQVYVERKEIIDGEEYITYEPSGERGFELDLFESAEPSDQLEHGFIWDYNYGHQESFKVSFDGDGKVVDVYQTMSAADLLDSRGP